MCLKLEEILLKILLQQIRELLLCNLTVKYYLRTGQTSNISVVVPVSNKIYLRKDSVTHILVDEK